MDYQRLISDSASSFFFWYTTYLSLGVSTTQRAGIINLTTEQVHLNTQYVDIPLKYSIVTSTKTPFKVLVALGLNMGIPYNQELNSSSANSIAADAIRNTSGKYNLGVLADIGMLYKMDRFNSFITLRTVSDFKSNYYKYLSQGINFGIQFPF